MILNIVEFGDVEVVWKIIRVVMWVISSDHFILITFLMIVMVKLLCPNKYTEG